METKNNKTIDTIKKTTTNFFALIGRPVIHLFTEMGKISNMTLSMFKWIFRKPFDFNSLLDQCVKVGYESLPVALITALATGSILALQTGLTLEMYFQGLSQYVPTIVVLAFVRELGPVLTGIIIAGRVGSAMAAEIGTMKVTEQVEALETLGTNPIHYLVVPRFLAMVIMMPIIVLFADYVGIIGGGIVCKTQLGLSWSTFWVNTVNSFTMGDVYSGLIKTFFFGGFIAIIGCYRGLQTSGGAEGVGKATTDAVVIGAITVLIADYFLSMLLNYTLHI